MPNRVRLFGFLCAVILLALTLGCTSASSTLTSLDGIYSLTPEQADSTMLAAIKEGWPDKEPVKLTDGRLGYQFKVWWAIDHDTMTIEALRVSENRYGFRVENSGTAPASGNPARERLLALVQQHAARHAHR